ncbi:MAG TPA: A/G-specific adenine glycosylase [Fimbriimonadaceae bacterium]|nr:A/G-specific adenine glycosylase [Fimbriimonadaceae bacterium]
MKKGILAGRDGGALLKWYDTHGRALPWRETREPYPVWVSEAMLQQTQVATVLPYYARWINRFPTVETLAQAELEEALALWQGLGYYRRGRMLHAGARVIVERGWPTSSAEWRQIPGVGRYTAAAIASICLGEPIAVVDGNVERVHARLSGSESSGAALHREAWTWAQEQLYAKRPGDWNQAMMELGARVCTPKNPGCRECPVAYLCIARLTHRETELPAPKARRATVDEVHWVWIPYFAGRFGMRRITDSRWWEGLWEFPRAVAPANEADLRALVGGGWVESIGSLRHTVTHHRIHVRASILRCEAAVTELTWLSREELAAIAMPAPQRKLLERALSVLGM